MVALYIVMSKIHSGGKRYDSVGLLESYIGIENKRVVGVF